MCYRERGERAGLPYTALSCVCSLAVSLSVAQVPHSTQDARILSSRSNKQPKTVKNSRLTGVSHSHGLVPLAFAVCLPVLSAFLGQCSACKHDCCKQRPVSEPSSMHKSHSRSRPSCSLLLHALYIRPHISASYLLDIMESRAKIRTD